MTEIARRSVLKSVGSLTAMLLPSPIRARVRFGPIGPDASPNGPWHPIQPGAARYIFVTAKIEGVETGALVDSGATRSVVSPALAERLRLPRIGEASATAFTGTVAGTMYRIASVELDGQHVGPIDAASYDMQNIESYLGHPVPLILGRDVLGQTALEIQFGQNRVRFLPHGARAGSGFAHMAIAASAANLPVVALKLPPLAPTNAIFDLGSNVPCSMSLAYAQASGLLLGQRTSTTLTTGAEGEEESLVFTMPEILIGEHRLVQVPICVVREWRLSEPVNVGWSLFRAFDLVLDIPRAALLLKADPASLAQPFPRDRSGIGAARLQDRILIRHVAANSPAERAGLKAGDEILTIDGRSIDDSYPPKSERVGERPAGTALTLGLSDGRQTQLVLADYF